MNMSSASDVGHCDFCGGKMKRQQVTMNYVRRGRKFTFSDVEAEVCQKCGERYFAAATLNNLDRQLGIKAQRGARSAA
jgi:YgiT-type zinc finger domain-containing protein